MYFSITVFNHLKVKIYCRISTTGEITLKTMSDYWVVGKISNLREFYVVIHQKNATLIEINGNLIIMNRKY